MTCSPAREAIENCQFSVVQVSKKIEGAGGCWESVEATLGRSDTIYCSNVTVAKVEYTRTNMEIVLK